MAQTQICGVVLPIGVAHHARIVAAKLGKSRSKLMRDLLVEYLKQYENPCENPAEFVPSTTQTPKPAALVSA